MTVWRYAVLSTADPLAGWRMGTLEVLDWSRVIQAQQRRVARALARRARRARRRRGRFGP